MAAQEMPTNLMMVGSLAFFDAPLDRDRLVRVLERRLLNHPRFRERIHPSVIGPPRWEVDPLFDLAAHVHCVALPAPGDDAELRLLVADLMSTPLDMTRPLRDVHIIENHGHGSVLLTRIHHAIADGTALVRLLLGLTAGEWSGRRGSNPRPLPWQGTLLIPYSGGAESSLTAATYPQLPRRSTLTTRGSTLTTRAPTPIR
jgi:hypothetical protein